jgi:hypothetical protein
MTSLLDVNTVKPCNDPQIFHGHPQLLIDLCNEIVHYGGGWCLNGEIVHLAQK